MAQLTIYLPDAVEKKAREQAKADGKSVSRWIADQIERNVDDTWPAEVLAAAGSIPDFPAADKLRQGYGTDSVRERVR